MAGLIEHEDYNDFVVNICPDGTSGEIIIIDNIPIQLPKKPNKKDILFSELKTKDQYWRRTELPKELARVKGMDEWYELPQETRGKYSEYIEKEFRRRRYGIWFMNEGEPTYITGEHYMFLQWSSIDIGYPSFFKFQQRILLHWEACVNDPRCFGQLYTKCRRSGYTNIATSGTINDATQVKDKLLGIQSKTGTDAQENVFIKKIVPIYLGYPFFFKPIQDGSSNPRMELAFREPAKRITKRNKTSTRGEALNTIINWKNTTNGAYDGEKTYRLLIDELYKWEKPANIAEAWRIQKTCLMVGRKIIGKARCGSTVNPLDKGGREGVKLISMSNPLEKDANGRTKSGLYHIYIPAYDALEGFFDIYGNCIVETPEKPIMGVDGELITIGSKEYLKNTRDSLRHDPIELNEHIRQFSWTIEEASRDSAKHSTFNIGKIYEQLEYNNSMYPYPVTRGNFVWKNGVRDSEVEWHSDPNGAFRTSWIPKQSDSNKKIIEYGVVKPANAHIGVGGVDSYDINKTVDTARSSKGALMLYNKFHMDNSAPTNMFVLEYAERPPTATMFYEDVLMASIYYGYPLLIENNKQRIIHYFEERGYIGYVMKRPDFLKPKNARYVTNDYGVPSNSADVIDQHAQAIESYVEKFVGMTEEGEMGRMYLTRTLEDFIGFDIDNRTEFDLTVAAGFALLGAQRRKIEKKVASTEGLKFFRVHKFNA